MTQIHQLDIQERSSTGTGSARAVRNSGFVPAIVYGDEKPPVAIEGARNVIEKRIHAGGFFTSLFDITIGGKKQRVLARDVQFHPVKDLAQHVDFMRVTDKTVINVEIPVHVINQDKSAALKSGGVLNMVRHTVELYVKANDIPEYIEVDISTVEMGESVHISEINLPAGSKPVISDRDFTILQISAPRVEEESTTAPEDAEAEEGEEGEAAQESADEDSDDSKE